MQITDLASGPFPPSQASSYTTSAATKMLFEALDLPVTPDGEDTRLKARNISRNLLIDSNGDVLDDYTGFMIDEDHILAFKVIFLRIMRIIFSFTFGTRQSGLVYLLQSKFSALHNKLSNSAEKTLSYILLMFFR